MHKIVMVNQVKRINSIDCNQTAMGLPPVTSAVFLIA
jgi:hypothetical protein